MMAASVLEKWTIFKDLDPVTVSSIKQFCVFDESSIFITKDDEVFGIGANDDGCLGLGDGITRDKPQKIEELSNKGINSIVCGPWHVLAVTTGGDLFSWGMNDYGQLGYTDSEHTLRPVQINTNLQQKRVIQAQCGSYHSLALTDEGEVFAWGWNNCGQIGSGTTANQHCPRRVAIERATSIACGASFSIALLETGEVYAWGSNGQGQLGLGIKKGNITTPCKIEGLSGIVIRQIVCGSAHTLALSDDGYVYSWGHNRYGQLGTGDTTDCRSPHKTNSDERFTEIAASPGCDMSAGLTERGEVFMWGNCDEQTITSPTLTQSSTTDDVFALSSSIMVTWRMYSIEVSGRTVISDLAKSFDDSTTSDIKFITQGKTIYCHKAILKIRCDHFRSMFQSHWDEDKKDSIEVPYPYHVYRAFLYFLYTDSLDLCPEEAIGLLELANCYCEKILKCKCEQIIKQGISIENAAMLYAAAVKFDAKELEAYCFKVAVDNLTAVTKTEAFSQLDETTHKSFILKASHAGAFKN